MMANKSRIQAAKNWVIQIVNNTNDSKSKQFKQFKEEIIKELKQQRI